MAYNATIARKTVMMAVAMRMARFSLMLFCNTSVEKVNLATAISWPTASAPELPPTGRFNVVSPVTLLAG